MRLRIMDGEPPILVREIKRIESRGRPCWLIIGEPVRVPIHGGGCQETTRYIVPVDYVGLRQVA